MLRWTPQLWAIVQAIILKYKVHEQQIFALPCNLALQYYNPPSESVRAPHFAYLQSGFQHFGAVEPSSEKRSALKRQPLQSTPFDST